MLLLLPFYIAFMFGHLLTSVLYALGKTNLVALKSVIGNIVIGSIFALTVTDILSFNLTNICLIFGSGLLLGSITSCAVYWMVVKKLNYTL